MLPLENIKILDLSRLAAGNMVSHMFADFGADVVKVEKPGKGDDLRNWKINGTLTGGLFIQETKEVFR